MPTSIRELCIARAKTLMDGLSGNHSFRDRRGALDVSEMPGAVVYSPAESHDDSQDFGTIRLVTMILDIETWVTAADDSALGPAMDAQYIAILTAMQGDPSLAGVANDCAFVGVDTPALSPPDSEVPVMGKLIKFKIQYWVSPTDPTSHGVG